MRLLCIAIAKVSDRELITDELTALMIPPQGARNATFTAFLAS
jgi:hypothetical protein